MAVRRKKDSSIVVAMTLVKNGTADAFVSAGSTGALLTGATLLVKRVKGIRRAAMGPVMPNKAGGKTVLLDCGANAECTPEFLLQFGLVASLYAKKTLNVANPRVGLLNIGTEDTKGTPLQKEAYVLLKNASDQGLINFIGNFLSIAPQTIYYTPRPLTEMDKWEKERLEQILGKKISTEAFVCYCTREEYEQQSGLSLKM